MPDLQFTFDDVTGTYRDANGRPVSDDDLRDALEAGILAWALLMAGLTLRLIVDAPRSGTMVRAMSAQGGTTAAGTTGGGIAAPSPLVIATGVPAAAAGGKAPVASWPPLSLASWQVAMADAIKLSHTAAAALAYGGLAELSPNRVAAIEGVVRVQLGYLDGWAKQLRTGEAALTEGAMLTRAGLYASSVRGTFSDVTRQLAVAHGANQEKNLLHSRDTCTGCRDATAAGWVSIGFLAPIGQRNCLSNCRCTIVHRVFTETGASTNGAA